MIYDSLDLRKLQQSISELGEKLSKIQILGQDGEDGLDADPKYIQELVDDAVAVVRADALRIINTASEEAVRIANRAVAAIPDLRGAGAVNLEAVKAMVAAAVAALPLPEDGDDGKPGAGLPPGGSTGQVPVKASDEDYDFEYRDLPAANGGAQMFGIGTLPAGPVIKDEGSVVTSKVASINFVGTGVAVTGSGDDVTVTVTAGGTSYTDEEAQDAVGTILADTATIDFTYTDATPEIKADVKDGSITFAKMQAITDGKLLGASGGTAVEEITVGTGLSLSSNALSTSITQYTDEMARDAIGAALVEGTAIDITVNDGADTITIAVDKSETSMAGFAATTSAELAAVISDETGSGALTFATAPTLIAPITVTDVGGSSAITINGATQTASFPIFDVSQTWNNAALAFTLQKFNVTSTASLASSLFVDYLLSGVSKFSVTRAGTVTLTGNINAASATVTAGILTCSDYILTNTIVYVRNNSGIINFGVADDAAISRLSAANFRLGAGASATPVAYKLTIGEASRGGTDNNTAGADGTLQPGAGTGNAAGSSLIFQTPTAGASGTTAQTYTTRLTLNETSATFAAKVISGAALRFKGYTVATLPAGTQGDNAYVTDALAPTFLATIVGGGAIVAPVFYDGTNWVGA